jgi:hypothetical protein
MVKLGKYDLTTGDLWVVTPVLRTASPHVILLATYVDDIPPWIWSGVRLRAGDEWGPGGRGSI